MSLKVLVVRPPSVRTIEILVAGVKYVDERVEFTILESNLIESKGYDEEIKFIDKVDFTKKKMSFFTKVKFVCKEFLKGNFNWKKAKVNAVNNFLASHSDPYYKNILSKYDVIHLNYLQKNSYDILKLVPKEKKIVISLWGSDVFRSPDEIIPLQKKSLDLADVITLHSDEMKEFFLNKYGKKYEDKVVKVLFGSSYKTIALINEIKLNNNYKTNELNQIDASKIVVRIGYSADPGQRHELIINELEKLKDRYKNKIHIILQLTYGGNEEYKKQVIQKIRNSSFDYTLFQNYLSNYEVLELAKRTDIFLNLRTTDALNNAMIESFLFDKLVIVGSWLPYQILSDKDVFFEKVDSINQLNETLIPYLEDIEYKTSEKKLNSSIVERLVSNKNTGKEWLELFKN